MSSEARFRIAFTIQALIAAGIGWVIALWLSIAVEEGWL